MDEMGSYSYDELREDIEMDPENEEKLAEAMQSWIGPPISRTTMAFLLRCPAAFHVPPSVPCDLGRVTFKAVLMKGDLGKRFFFGQLSQFFSSASLAESRKGLDAHEMYRPSDFLPDYFRETIRAKFGLLDNSWSLWMAINMGAPAIRITTSPDLLDFFSHLTLWYLRKEPFTHHLLWIMVVLDNSETARRFSTLPQPQDMVSPDAAVHISRRSSSMYSTDADFTPTTSDFDGESYGQISEDEGLRQMDSAVYVEPSEVPAELSTPEPEPVEVPGILEFIDTDTKKGSDVVDGDLDAILPVTTSPNDEEFARLCTFLSLEPDKHKVPVIKSVAIPFTNIYLTPRQYVAALKMLHSRGERGLFGGVLADVPGTGKTHTCIAVVLFRALVAYNMAEVKKEWETREYEAAKGKASRGFKHLPRDATGTEKCPCGDLQGVLCYANAKGITRDIGDTMSRGVSLILAPQGVIEEWKTVFTNSLMSRKFFEPCLIHTTSERELTCPPTFAKRFQLKAAPLEDGFSKGYKPRVTDMGYTYAMDTEQGKQPERFIIITTHQIEKLREQFQVPVMLTVANKKEKTSVYGLPVGCMMVDEFHKVRAMNNPVVQLAQEHKHIMGDESDFWSVTGTMMPKSTFTDLESTITILQRPTWTHPEHMYYGSRLECINELELAYSEAVSADRGSEAAVEMFKDKARDFFEGLVIRHTMDTTFFGQRITKVKEIKPMKKTFTIPAEHLDDMQTLANQVKAKIHTLTQSDSYEQVVRSLQTYIELTPLQLASTFPAAAALILDGTLKPDVASLRALIKKAKGDVTAISEFTAHVDVLASSSAKLEEIVSMFCRMESDTQARPKPDEPPSSSGPPRKSRDNRQLKKMVIVTPTLAEAVFLHLTLKKRLASLSPHPKGGVKTVLLHADLLASEKQRMVTDFQALTPGSARVLVTPYEVGGTGLNLQTANYQVLTGPLRTKDYELQAFARTNREGNMLRLNHWLYLTDDSPADRLIVARQANRRVVSEPFEVGMEFVVEGEGGVEEE